VKNRSLLTSITRLAAPLAGRFSAIAGQCSHAKRPASGAALNLWHGRPARVSAAKTWAGRPCHVSSAITSKRVAVSFRTLRPFFLLLFISTCALAITVEELVSAPVADPAMRPMTETYRIVLSRSIFSKDHRPAVAKVLSVATTRPDVASSASGPEASFVLNGVAIEDDVVTAFFEQTADHQIVRTRTGESIARGVINAITLDGVDYVVDGKSSHVSIGQSLDGGTAVIVSSPSSAAPSAPAEHPAGEKPSWWRKKSTSSNDSSSTPSSTSTPPEKEHKKKHKSKSELE